MIIELLTSRYPGMRLWLSQRLTAVYMAAYLIVLVLVLLVKSPSNYVSWVTIAAHWLFKLGTGLFLICLLIHAWVGIRDVLRDYVFNLTLRAIIQVIVELLLVAYLIWFGAILWQI